MELATTPTATALVTTSTTAPRCRTLIRPTPAPMGWATRASRPTCSSTRRRRIGDNPIIGPGTVIGAGVGSATTRCWGAVSRSSRGAIAGDRVRLGDFVVVGVRARLGSAPPWATGVIEMGVRVGNAVTVGDGAVIRRNALIGNRAAIGPLAVLDVGARIGGGRRSRQERRWAGAPSSRRAPSFPRASRSRPESLSPDARQKRAR